MRYTNTRLLLLLSLSMGVCIIQTSMHYLTRYSQDHRADFDAQYVKRLVLPIHPAFIALIQHRKLPSFCIKLLSLL